MDRSDLRHGARRRAIPPRRPRIFALATLASLALGAMALGVVAGAGGTGSEAAEAGTVTEAERGSSDAEPRPRGAGSGEVGPRAAARSESCVKPRSARRRAPKIRWRRSEAVGTHAAGKLRRGVLLPPEGRSWVSWDPILKRRPNREWRRWGTDRLVRATLDVLREFGREHPRAPRVAVGDLSRPKGGDFGPQFGSIGHASHQNGLDVDIYYPRKDERVRPPKRPGQVDLKLAQNLVDRFVEAGAEKVFVGPSLGLRGPSDVVVPLAHHDNHLHARLPV